MSVQYETSGNISYSPSLVNPNTTMNDTSRLLLNRYTTINLKGYKHVFVHIFNISLCAGVVGNNSNLSDFPTNWTLRYLFRTGLGLSTDHHADGYMDFDELF